MDAALDTFAIDLDQRFGNRTEIDVDVDREALPPFLVSHSGMVETPRL